MNRHRALIRSAVLGVSGVVVLFVLLVGFLAMHGLASTSATGVHHSAVTLMASPGEEAHTAVSRSGSGPMAESDVAGHAIGDRERPPLAPENEEGGSDASHGLMIGCLFILCAAVAAIVLRRSRARSVTARDWSFSTAAGHPPARKGRPPPLRIHLSLCVLRV